MLSLDGFIEGSSRELYWHVWDEEMENYMYNDVLNKVDAILLGRMAYQLLADYWQSTTDSIASKMNNLPKIVFSKTLEKVGWNNSRRVRENLADETRAR